MSDQAEKTRIYMREYMRRYRERGPKQRAERKRRAQEASERHD